MSLNMRQRWDVLTFLFLLLNMLLLVFLAVFCDVIIMEFICGGGGEVQLHGVTVTDLYLAARGHLDQFAVIISDSYWFVVISAVF